MLIKRAFLPKLDALLLFDYKNIEPRLTAYYMSKSLGDHQLTEEFNNGIDPYQTIARDIGVTRQVAKMVFLAIEYGIGKRKLSSQLGVTEAEALRIVKRFHKVRPGVKRLMKKTEAVAANRGYIKTLYGRHLHPEPGFEYRLLNKLIQGCAADIMKEALRKTHYYMTGEKLGTFQHSHLVSTIHDELIVDARLDEIPRLVKEIPPLMINAEVHAIVPMEVEIEWTTTNWAEKVAYNGQ